MKPKTKTIILRILGTISIAYGLFAISAGIYFNRPDLVFWFCYLALILVGIGCFIKSDSLIASQINLTAGFLIFWLIDFFYQFITKEPLWNITNYFFNQGWSIPKIVSLEHFFLLPLSLYALYLVKLKSKDFYKISIFQGISIFIILRAFNISEYNVNCAFRRCASFIPEYPSTILNWLVFFFIMIFITNYVVVKLFYEEERLCPSILNPSCQ